MSVLTTTMVITWSCLGSQPALNTGGGINFLLTEPPASAVAQCRRSSLAISDSFAPQAFQYGETLVTPTTLYAQLEPNGALLDSVIVDIDPVYLAEITQDNLLQTGLQKSTFGDFQIEGEEEYSDEYERSDEGPKLYDGPVLLAQELGGVAVSRTLESSDDPVGDYLEEKRGTPSDAEKSGKNTQPAFEIGLPALMDGRYLGDVNVRVRGDEISLEGPSFIDLLRPDLTKDALGAIETAIDNNWLVIGTFLVEGVDVKYDPALQQIEISTPIGSRERRVLRLGSEQRELNIPLAEPGKFSFFITPVISSLYNWDEINGLDRGFQPIRGSLNVGGRIFGEKGVGFFSRQSFITGGTNGGLRRDETVAFYDMLPNLLRVSAGDLRPRALSFQSAPRISGLSLERFFDLEPNRLFRPVAQSSFELERPSTVEIRLNGVTRREITLQPGRFNISDLPLTQGSNLVDLVIRDDLGRERIISDQSFFDFGLLEPGVTDFSLSAGVKTRTTNSGIAYTDELAATGFLRRGITNSLTLGADLQGDKDGGNGGISALYASPYGVFTLEGAASEYSDTGSGYAGVLGYRYLGDGGNDWSWSFNATGRYFSENFSTLRGADLGSNIPLSLDDGLLIDTTFSDVRAFSFLFNAGARVRKGRWAFSAAGSHNMGRGLVEDTTNIVGGINYQLSTRMNIGLFGNHSINGDEEETSAVIQLNYRFGRGRDVRSSFDTQTQELDVRYSQSAALGVGSLNYNFGTRNNFETDRNGINANAFYTGNRFEANLDHSIVNQGGDTGGGFQQVSQVTLGTSLVFVDGAFGAGRPVQSTFAILQPHSTLKGKKILINPTESGFSNSSDFLGPAVATEGQAFSRRSVYYDVVDLPIGYDLGEGQYSTRAPIFAGYKIPIGSGASFTIIGNLKNADTGEPLPFIGGRLESLDDVDADPVSAFTNRNGRLAASGLKPGRYTLVVFTEPEFRKDLTIPEEGNSLIDLGDLEVDLK